jgi:hypothetical protein
VVLLTVQKEYQVLALKDFAPLAEVDGHAQA